ncbi:hypothetical protein Hypma_001464 [Hypsizygus marmoreus]|uniref:Uncharacterized protein n=1 Tax=Hypsizygus marmoreus TaxID=39966 RepID=A0A369KB13_HYPMA|nr:hypothetical protein Hypma_001464 [Hypsizygus marmoreus]
MSFVMAKSHAQPVWRVGWRPSTVSKILMGCDNNDPLMLLGDKKYGLKNGGKKYIKPPLLCDAKGVPHERRPNSCGSNLNGPEQGEGPRNLNRTKCVTRQVKTTFSSVTFIGLRGVHAAAHWLALHLLGGRSFSACVVNFDAYVPSNETLQMWLKRSRYYSASIKVLIRMS